MSAPLPSPIFSKQKTYPFGTDLFRKLTMKRFPNFPPSSIRGRSLDVRNAEVEPGIALICGAHLPQVGMIKMRISITNKTCDTHGISGEVFTPSQPKCPVVTALMVLSV